MEAAEGTAPEDEDGRCRVHAVRDEADGLRVDSVDDRAGRGGTGADGGWRVRLLLSERGAHRLCPPPCSARDSLLGGVPRETGGKQMMLVQVIQMNSFQSI